MLDRREKKSERSVWTLPVEAVAGARSSSSYSDLRVMMTSAS